MRMLALVVFAVFGWVRTPFLQPAQDAAAKSPWVLDDDGLRQWKEPGADCQPCSGSGKAACAGCEEPRADKCAECKGKREADCRACGGEGEAYDPLEEMTCPYCNGSALWICGNCSGGGNYKIVGGGKKGQKCGPCKGSGRLKCEACKGKRAMSMAKIGRNPGDAKAFQLEKAKETITDSLNKLKLYSPAGNDSTNTKTFELTIEDARGTVPGLKNTEKLVEAGVKSLRVSAMYVGYEEDLAREFKRFRYCTVKYLEAQLALIELCTQRLEFNDKVQGR